MRIRFASQHTRIAVLQIGGKKVIIPSYISRSLKLGNLFLVSQREWHLGLSAGALVQCMPSVYFIPKLSYFDGPYSHIATSTQSAFASSVEEPRAHIYGSPTTFGQLHCHIKSNMLIIDGLINNGALRWPFMIDVLYPLIHCSNNGFTLCLLRILFIDKSRSRSNTQATGNAVPEFTPISMSYNHWFGA